MARHETRELLTVREAAERAGVCRRTIYNWITWGRIARIRTAGGQTRVYADTLFRARREPESDRGTVIDVDE